jgi:hypothetical protein
MGHCSSCVTFNLKLSFLSASAGFLLCLLFDPEDVGDMFLQNIGLSPCYTACQSKKLYYSQSQLRKPQLQHFPVLLKFWHCLCCWKWCSLRRNRSKSERIWRLRLFHKNIMDLCIRQYPLQCRH